MSGGFRLAKHAGLSLVTAAGMGLFGTLDASRATWDNADDSDKIVFNDSSHSVENQEYVNSQNQSSGSLSSSSSSSPEPIGLSTVGAIITCIIIGLIICATIVGNLLVCIAISTDRGLKQVSDKAKSHLGER